MKKLLMILLFVSSFFIVSMSNAPENETTFGDLSNEEKRTALEYMISNGECEWNGIKLYGKVEFVTSYPDLTIKYVENFPDIRVQFVESFPDDCGKWQVVSSFPDFTVMVVENFPDLEIQIVENFPGLD